ncbi:unnamed protein product [Psylliodes chrysocephalus]|uniref:Mitochondrial cytochrome c oxidase subunit VIc/VIIs domain-containing protein n=1 Tax=Psylliodes chrysocephalus TaxID=3402493 RepID=A0A9P0GNF8_9CUCU|nr:unnamed protein product [Psylliodes chrysocephala]
MASECKVKKPQLHGLLKKRAIRSIYNAVISAAIAGFLFRMVVCSPRQQAYKKFHEAYDANAEFEKIRMTGVFDSC